MDVIYRDDVSTIISPSLPRLQGAGFLLAAIRYRGSGLQKPFSTIITRHDDVSTTGTLVSRPSPADVSSLPTPHPNPISPRPHTTATLKLMGRRGPLVASLSQQRGLQRRPLAGVLWKHVLQPVCRRGTCRRIEVGPAGLELFRPLPVGFYQPVEWHRLETEGALG